MRVSLGIVYLTLLAPLACWADSAAATRWLEQEFKPSTLTREQQQQELQ